MVAKKVSRFPIGQPIIGWTVKLLLYLRPVHLVRYCSFSVGSIVVSWILGGCVNEGCPSVQSNGSCFLA
jgi:hypothetical protein